LEGNSLQITALSLKEFVSFLSFLTPYSILSSFILFFLFSQGHFPLAMTMLIPNKHVGRVIGKKGAHIKDIQEQSGAIIHLPKTSRYGSDHREVCIYGTAEAIARCQELLQVSLLVFLTAGISLLLPRISLCLCVSFFFLYRLISLSLLLTHSLVFLRPRKFFAGHNGAS
jgi:hypothetical protein